MQLIQLPHSAISVIVVRKRVKNVNLRIGRDGVVKVSIPLRYSVQHAELFLKEKEAWIVSHLARVKAQQSLHQSKVPDDQTCVHLGKTYSLIVYECRQGHSIQLEAEQLVLFVQPKTLLSKKRMLISEWQRCQMRALLFTLIAKWEPIIGVSVAEWGIKAMTSRWGSCNPLKRRIWLNLHLIQKPIVCLEYVLVHEMVHLLEASHNQRFYALMSHFMPTWKEHKRLLNT